MILADLANYSTDHMRPHLAGLHPLLANGLNAANIDVQVPSRGLCLGVIDNDSRSRVAGGAKSVLVGGVVSAAA